MNLTLVSVFDRAVQAYMPPFAVAHTGQAIRSFSDEVKAPREGNNLANHPDDFELYALGVVDDQTGLVTPNTPPLLLVSGTQVKSLS